RGKPRTHGARLRGEAAAQREIAGLPIGACIDENAVLPAFERLLDRSARAEAVRVCVAKDQCKIESRRSTIQSDLPARRQNKQVFGVKRVVGQTAIVMIERPADGIDGMKWRGWSASLRPTQG